MANRLRDLDCDSQVVVVCSSPLWITADIDRALVYHMQAGSLPQRVAADACDSCRCVPRLVVDLATGSEIEPDITAGDALLYATALDTMHFDAALRVWRAPGDAGCVAVVHAVATGKNASGGLDALVAAAVSTGATLAQAVVGAVKHAEAQLRKRVQDVYAGTLLETLYGSKKVRAPFACASEIDEVITALVSIKLARELK